MTTSKEWDDIHYKVFSTGLSGMRRFSIPQHHTEDPDILHATQQYYESRESLKQKGKLANKEDHKQHNAIITSLTQLLLDKQVHVKRF